MLQEDKDRLLAEVDAKVQVLNQQQKEKTEIEAKLAVCRCCVGACMTGRSGDGKQAAQRRQDRV